MAARYGIVAFLVTVLVLPVRAQAPGGLTLMGCVMFFGGDALPGVQITVTGETTARTVVTDGSGCYEAAGLPPGAYDVSASLQGFQTETKNDVSVRAVRVERLNFAMHLGGSCECMMTTFADMWRFADAVVHVHLDAHEPDDTIVSSYPAVRHMATVLTTFKEPATSVPRSITFVQFRRTSRGEIVEPVHASGQGVVLFLNWNPALGVYVRSLTGNGPPAAFAVLSRGVQITGLADENGNPFYVPLQELRERAMRPQ